MRLVTYDRGGARRLGAWVGEGLVDLPDAVGHPAFPATLEALVTRSRGSSMDAARAALANPSFVEDALVERRGGLLAPLLLSEAEHGQILGPGDPLEWPGDTRCEWRPEVACVLGRGGRRLTLAAASELIFGYLLVSSWSVPDLEGQPGVGRRATALGPCLVTADEFDPSEVSFTARVNRGVWVRQRIAETEHRFARTIARASRQREVLAGEVFSGAPFEPGLPGPRLLTRDAVLEIDAGPLGILRNRVRFRAVSR